MGLSSQSSMHEALLMEEADNLGSGGGGSSPCVPTVVMMCIRHLEQFGLRTVGIFRVSSSKKRVRQVSGLIRKIKKRYRRQKRKSPWSRSLFSPLRLAFWSGLKIPELKVAIRVISENLGI